MGGKPLNGLDNVLVSFLVAKYLLLMDAIIVFLGIPVFQFWSKTNNFYVVFR